MDAVTSTTDTLSYDGLNRLTQAATSNPGQSLSLTKTVTYDAIGNITNKSDVGDYAYDPVHVHAVSGITPGATGTLTASFTYDGDGNLLTGKGRTLIWTSFDMVSQVALGANTLGFTYDSEHARLKEASSDGSTKYYLNDPISGIIEEKAIGASLAVSWNDYVMKGAEMVALHVTAATPQIRYFHKDHLGSIVALTDESGAVVERDSYDAWGARRNPSGPDDPLYPGLSLTSQVTRGYTGHEQLDTVGLVHMNGRIYDPVIGKMMSADPTVPNPADAQAYNRYAYVGNNPLSLTDPTGFRDIDPDRPGRMSDPLAGDRPAHHEPDPRDGISDADAGDSTDSTGPRPGDIQMAGGKNVTGGGWFLGGDAEASGGIGSMARRAAPTNPAAEAEGAAAGEPTEPVGTEPEGPAPAASPLDSNGRLPQDVRVDPNPPTRLEKNRAIGLSPTQNKAAQDLVRKMEEEGYKDIRVNQQQVNAKGQRVGINRPDVQGTNPTTERREYHELDTDSSRRAIDHYDRIKANDPDGDVHLHNTN